MTITKETNSTMLYGQIWSRVSDIEQRERLVLKLPFGSPITRIEIYCGETVKQASDFGIMVSGAAFDGPVSISVFSDYGNKPTQKMSYTYKAEFKKQLEALCIKLPSLCK